MEVFRKEFEDFGIFLKDDVFFHEEFEEIGRFFS